MRYGFDPGLPGDGVAVRWRRQTAGGGFCLIYPACRRTIYLLRVRTEISRSHSTIRGIVHHGTSQQGDGPTNSSETNSCVSFFSAHAAESGRVMFLRISTATARCVEQVLRREKTSALEPIKRRVSAEYLAERPSKRSSGDYFLESALPMWYHLTNGWGLPGMAEAYSFDNTGTRRGAKWVNR